jgi:hypothetical protein
MAGLWDQPGVPHNGWQCTGVEDLGADGGPVDERDYATCEMCGHERIRFLHSMEHPKYSLELKVGCVCAEKMSDDYVGPREREDKLRNRAGKRGRWLTRRWRQSKNGNPYIRVGGYNLVVFPDRFRSNRWKFSIDGEFSPRAYASEDEAKLALFDAYSELPEKVLDFCI